MHKINTKIKFSKNKAIIWIWYSLTKTIKIAVKKQ